MSNFNPFFDTTIHQMLSSLPVLLFTSSMSERVRKNWSVISSSFPLNHSCAVPVFVLVSSSFPVILVAGTTVPVSEPSYLLDGHPHLGHCCQPRLSHNCCYHHSGFPGHCHRNRSPHHQHHHEYLRHIHFRLCETTKLHFTKISIHEL